VAVTPGKGKLTITGKLGDVMQESAQAAMSYIRSRASSIGMDGEFHREVDVHVHGFDRPNLELSVEHVKDDGQKDAFLEEFLRRERGPGIIYVGTRRMTEELTEYLKPVEPRMIAYHAGMAAEDRTRAQEAFLGGRARVAAATIAFGMGIDKPDVRFVIHYHYPGSVEQYYQEIGRAGRDGRPSRCVLLYSAGDRGLREFFIDLYYPAPDQVKSVMEAVFAVRSNPVLLTYDEIANLCEQPVRGGQVAAALRLLGAAGITRLLSGGAAAEVGLDRPGAEILPKLRGKVQRRVFEALSIAADLGTPGPLVNFVAMSVEEALTKYLVAIEELETFSLREAAERTPYSAKYLNLRARDGSLGAYKRGRNWRVTGEDLERYVKGAKG